MFNNFFRFRCISVVISLTIVCIGNSHQIPASSTPGDVSLNKNPAVNPQTYLNTCGKQRKKIQYLMLNSLSVEFGDLPWVVGIYDKTLNNQQVCAGSLITPYVILTAGHCFFNRVTNTKRQAVEFTVAIGKVFRDFDVVDSEHVEYYEIESIILDGFYNPDGKFVKDIAMLETKEEMKFSHEATAICLPFKNIQLRPSCSLHVSGWGNDETKKPSTVLRAAELPYVNFEDCLHLMHEDTKKYLSIDQFCLKHVNGTEVTLGDSGGAVTFRMGYNSQHYIVGIVSFSEVNGGSPVSVITSVFSYLDFIIHTIRKVHGHKGYDVNYLHLPPID